MQVTEGGAGQAAKCATLPDPSAADQILSEFSDGFVSMSECQPLANSK